MQIIICGLAFFEFSLDKLYPELYPKGRKYGKYGKHLLIIKNCESLLCRKLLIFVYGC